MEPGLTRASAIAVCLALLLASGCAEEAPAVPPPPEVEIIAVKTQSIDNVIELPGRVQAFRTAEVRARVTGIVARRLYAEGSEVRAGQALFAIDPSELKASLNAVQAALARADSSAANARQDVNRYQPLLKDQAISKQEYDAAVARLGGAEADVAQARAQVESARLNLNYATVTAPISGRAGRAQVTEGALVSAGGATLLTTIEQLNPVFVNFSQSSSDLISIRRDIASGKIKVPEFQTVRVELELEDGTIFSQTGRLDFLDLSFDQSTGVSALRAEFPNAGQILLPGQFVRARIFAGERQNAMLLPQRAVTVGPKGGTVMVVTAENKAEPRPVTLGDLRGAQWVVLGGLKAGDRVITSGLQKVRPGAVVRVAGPQAATPEQTAGPQAAEPDQAAGPQAAAQTAGPKPAQPAR